jgi:phenylalanyl-tRNA synthetase beta chain
MKISYDWLQSFFAKKLPAPEKLADLLTMHSFETELVGRRENDYLLDVDVLPNRAHDCLSYSGIAREIAVLLKQPFKPIDYAEKIKTSDLSVKDLVKVEVRDKKLCPRYTAQAVIDVKVGPSPKWMQQRLKVSGLRPINNIVDIANYVMLETGQPLHAFDADKLETKDSKAKVKTLIVRRAKKGEKIITLDNEEYDLDENILVIADEKNPTCVAGIKGGQGPSIDKDTKRVILEAANFNYQIIRQGSRQLKLETDASWRFSHQLDPNLTEGAVNMASYLIQELAGGQVLKELIDVYPNKVRPWQVKLDIERTKSLLGIDISFKGAKGILERLGFEVKNLWVKPSNSKSQTPKSSRFQFQVTVPTRRIDVSMPEDLIEEIGRIYGLEKIPSRLPSAVLIPPQRNEDLVYQNKVRDILSHLGFSEVYNYSFVSDREAGLYQEKPDLIELTNPVSQEQKYLRPNLILNLLKNIKDNKRFFNEIRLFEIGKVFQGGKRDKAEETKRLAGIIDLSDSSNQPQEFYELKGIIDLLFNKLRLGDIWYDDEISDLNSVLDLFHVSRRAEIKSGQNCLGWLGEISGKILRQFEIESRVAAFELNFEKLVELATEEREYLPPSKYPAVVRDIALLVESGTKVIEVMNLIHAAGGPLVRDIDLFDIYEGEQIPEGKKNLAFHIVFQSDDHTLTDKEVNALQDKIIKALEEEGGWEVRR